ncbi:putative serine/threonine-protein kinase [Tetrabaena socialis]|uniref:Putative serine/threonine-protein kinase n=1 Tax=Tetrabaena socialis TaxID=47790 RepID=A0A2J7ZR55_9CHLO|nr:putative serine/threonine-protein kinase [Tetrabaena socialis]|eukprot:PNH02754.1 putative serine/threonine-protein kinase [Tetrabaena socialis]
MGRCQHPNIVRIMAACLKPPRPFLVMELMDTALDKLMYAKGPTLLPLDLVLHIAIEIARGLAYLHPTIVHRDLKPANVLINDPWGERRVVKISDFGLSRLNSSIALTQSPEAGTPAYVAPECFEVDNYSVSYKADMYSFGVLLWEMLAGVRPWEGLGVVPIAFQVTVKGRRLPMPPLDKLGSSPAQWPPRLCEMLQECWDQAPDRRPAAAELAKRLVLIQQVRC